MKKFLKMVRFLAVERQALQLHRGLIPVDRDGFQKRRVSSVHSLKRACREFDAIDGKVIVEIGTGLHSRLSGCSMIEWTQRTAATAVHAVDLDPDRIEEIRKAMGMLERVHPVVADGMQFLRDFEGDIDLLYLDFWIPDPPDATVGTGRADAYLTCYENARERLAGTSLILIDDTDHVSPWKHTRIIDRARADGFYPLWMGRQTMLKRDS